jgi:dynein heavy chain 1, cytosolic
VKALDLIDQYIDAIGKDRSNVDPEKLPWLAIKVMLTENIYGGKIGNNFGKIK